jgi:hypothetical protein
MIDEAERAGGYCGPRFDADRGMTRQITAIQAKLFDTQIATFRSTSQSRFAGSMR